jgi:hypothetical protein
VVKAAEFLPPLPHTSSWHGKISGAYNMRDRECKWVETFVEIVEGNNLADDA